MDNGPGKVGRVKQNKKAKPTKAAESLKHVLLQSKIGNFNISDYIKQSDGTSTVTHVPTIPVNNEYDMLSDDDDSSSTHTAVQNTEKLDKCAPIVIVNSNVTAIQNRCNNIIKSKKFEISLMSIGIKVKVTDAKECDALEEHLKKQGIQSFKYYTSKNKPKRIVVLGLHSIDTNELKQYLSENNVNPDAIENIHD